MKLFKIIDWANVILIALLITAFLLGVYFAYQYITISFLIARDEPFTIIDVIILTCIVLILLLAFICACYKVYQKYEDWH